MEMKEIKIELPNLEIAVFDLLEDKNTTFSEAAEVNGFPFENFLMVDAFLSLTRLELEKTGEYLGLSLVEQPKSGKK